MITGELLLRIWDIIIIDLVLSGDNAVVIGLAASRLQGRDRRMAIIFGVAGAIGLRILFTGMFALLLVIPFLQLVGGILLIWIAYKLLRPAHDAHDNIKAASNRWDAIRTIVMADVVMSLDNILAVGGAAHGELWLLLFGLALSMPLITFGSSYIARALDRWSWLVYIGSGVLARVSAQMIIHDPFVKDYFATPAAEYGFQALVVVGVLGIGYLARRRHAETLEQTADIEAAAAERVGDTVTPEPLQPAGDVPADPTVNVRRDGRR